jgi:hypothetical protein
MAGLEDRHPYVRRTAVMGVLKIWHMSSDVVESQGMLQHVQLLLAQDSDAQVAANCLTVMLQVQVSTAGRRAGLLLVGVARVAAESVSSLTLMLLCAHCACLQLCNSALPQGVKRLVANKALLYTLINRIKVGLRADPGVAWQQQGRVH